MATGDKKLIQITGRVIERKTKQGLSGLRVEAWDKDLIVKNPIGAATTDQQGAFVIETSKPQLNELFAGRHVLLFFKVFRGDQLIASTEASVVWDRDVTDSEVTIKVSPEDNTGATITVSGQVRRLDGSVFAQGFVQAFITIRGQETMIAEAQPGSNGQFQLTATLDQSQTSQLAGARMVVRAFDDKRALLAETPSFAPDATVTVNVIVPNAPRPPVTTVSVQGTIRRRDGSPIAEAVVRVFVTSPGKEILFGEARTDSAGRYLITSTDRAVTSPPANARLEARVFDRAGARIGSSSSPISEGSSTVDVDVEPPTSDETCIVHGRIFQANGKPLDTGTVRIFGVVPFPELQLGEQAINRLDDGNYRIEYHPGKFSVSKGDQTRVVVRVFRVIDGQERLLEPSSPLFAANGIEFVVITLRDSFDETVQTQTFTVHGLITRGGNAVVSETLNVSASDGSVPLGQTPGTDAQGNYEITYTVGPSGKIPTAPANLKVTVVDGTTVVSAALVGVATGNDVINIQLPGPQPPGDSTVEGRIFLDYGLAASNVVVRVYNRGFGGSATMLRETTTGKNGSFKVDYNSGGGVVNLELRVLDPDHNEVTISATKFKASKREVFTLIAPARVQPLAPEYGRLTADLRVQLPPNSTLGDAREDAANKDLTLLHQATGWDARAIALAAMANHLHSETGIGEEPLYAFFRAGLPTDKQKLAGVGAAAVQEALNTANAARIVSLTPTQLAAAVNAFGQLAGKVQALATAPGTLSNVGDLLNASVLVGSSKKQIFQDLYFANPTDGGQLWKRASDAGINADQIRGLQLQGKLAYLTFNNVELMKSLGPVIQPPNDITHLVELGFYTPEKWTDRLNSLVNSQHTLASLIPPAYTGDTSERLDAYAKDLARRVRLSFPTQVVTRMIGSGELPVGDSGLGQNVANFLKNAAAKGFELGRTPFDLFVHNHSEVTASPVAGRSSTPAVHPGGALFAGISTAAAEATTQAVRQLQRLYQVTPSDQSLKTVYESGFTSARDIASYSFTDFIDRFGSRFPSLAEAGLVYRKAQQVSAVTSNFFATASQMDSVPPMFVTSPSTSEREAAKGELIKRFPTMKDLFGSLDFCECEHCRSVLSPAAYLVDLLHFLDTREATNPYDVLEARRPDLPQLPLTCENTNTVLPYIDVVNEIFEYYVAHNRLDSLAVRDTGDATSEDLLAEPQYITNAAYDKLTGAKYPLGLPFDPWLETVREFIDQFGTPLWRVLEVFRPADDLFPAAANPKAYYRSSIFAEYLGLSPTEYAIFIDPNAGGQWYELYGYADRADAVAELKKAKTLAGRLGVTYKELMAIVRTGFVNSKLDSVVIPLRRIGAGVDSVFRYKQHSDYTPFTTDEAAAFEKRLDDASFPVKAGSPGFNARTWLDDKWQQQAFDKIVVLADPDTGCNFDETILRYANVTGVDDLVFIRINLFVRLWKKLGWTIEEIDRALQTFLPASSRPLTLSNIGEALKTALVYLAHLKALDDQVKVGKISRAKLLTFWSNLSTTGENPLYAQLFLTRTILKDDPVFDSPIGDYLSQDLFVKDHILALQGALNLTEDDVRQVFDHLDIRAKAFANAKLTLENVSLLYRYGLLAKALKLSIPDLIALKKMSGLDAFTALDPKPLTSLNLPAGADAIEEDFPFTQTLRFVELAEKVKESGFKIEDLDYILRHRFDAVGKYRENPAEHLDFVRLLSTAMQRIEAENSPQTLTDEVLRQKLALVLPADVADTFMAMLSGTIEYEAAQTGVSEDNRLDPEDFAKEPAVKVIYDAVFQVQRLVFKGVLLDNQKNVLATSTKEPSTFLGTLLDTVQKQARSFFEDHLQKSGTGGFSVGFLNASDFELLFAPSENDAAKETQLSQKRDRLSGAFLPFLQQRLTRQLVVQTVAGNLSSNPALTEALLSDTKLLYDPSQTATTATKDPLLDAFIAAREEGVSASFFDLTDNLLEAKRVGSTDTSEKPIGTHSARFRGFLEVPTTGPYRFFAHLDKSVAKAEFRIADRPDPLLRETAITDNTEISPNDAFIELKAGVAYGFTFEVQNLGTGGASLLVQGENLPKGSLARLRLYPADSVERVRRARVLMAKSLQLIVALGLNEREIRYLLTHAQDFDDIDLGKLPTRESDDSQATAVTLFRQLVRLLDYTKLKREIAAGTDDLISIFENASRTPSEPVPELAARVAALTRRDKVTTQNTAASLGMTTAAFFAQEKGLLRLWDGLQLVQQLGISPDAIASSTRIVAQNRTSEERSAIAHDLRNTVKARYEPETWQRIAQPVFDKLRRKQRDALTAYLIDKLDFDSIEQLFEYFLIDPGMEPVVQTSRLRLAISSVQLFIQRVLLNLEPDVAPSALNSEHWEWMKRYRVWEANRKIFLFPENWIEPEFRDDKTHLFKELEGTLLQGDVSNDLAEDAFFTYLKQLEELARLEIVTIYNEEKPSDSAANILHVIGRTYGVPRKYFYRRYAHRMWTPWEPVSAEIDGDHVVAVVWHQRLHLFWLTFMEKADPKANDDKSPTDMAKMTSKEIKPATRVEAQLNWSEQFQGEWTPRKSAGFSEPLSLPLVSGSGAIPIGDGTFLIFNGPSFPESFNAREAFVHVSRETVGGEDRRVNIHLGGQINWIFRFARNSPPQQADIFGAFTRTLTPTAAQTPYMANALEVTHLLVSGALAVLFTDRTVTSGGITETAVGHPRDIVQPSDNGFSLVRSSNLLEITTGETRALLSPFFLMDNQNTFFVEPRLTETTIQTYDHWAPPPPLPDPTFVDPSWWKNIPLAGLVPFVDPEFPFDHDPSRLFEFKPNRDWLGDPASILQYGQSFVGASGGLDFQLLSPGAGIGLPTPGAVLILPATIAGTLSLPSGGLSVIGNGGLNPVLLNNLNTRRLSNPVLVPAQKPSTPTF